MKRPSVRHFSEEELLMHILGEGDPKGSALLEAHLGECQECSTVFIEYRQLLEDIHCWKVDEISEAAWQQQKERLASLVRDESGTSFRGVWRHLGNAISQAWDYAVAHPLPALGYIALALAFASQRTISIFHLDQILPSTGEVIQVLRMVL
jgi:anti-sigma factor RsiW